MAFGGSVSQLASNILAEQQGDSARAQQALQMLMQEQARRRAEAQNQQQFDTRQAQNEREFGFTRQQAANQTLRQDRLDAEFKNRAERDYEINKGYLRIAQEKQNSLEDLPIRKEIFKTRLADAEQGIFKPDPALTDEENKLLETRNNQVRLEQDNAAQLLTASFASQNPKRPALKAELGDQILSDFMAATGEAPDDTTPANREQVLSTVRSMPKKSGFVGAALRSMVPVVGAHWAAYAAATDKGRKTDDKELAEAEAAYKLNDEARVRSFANFASTYKDRGAMDLVVPEVDRQEFTPKYRLLEERRATGGGFARTATTPTTTTTQESPQVQAEAVRAAFKAGQMTKEEALTRLRALGFQ